MKTAIDDAIEITGWDPDVVASLYAEYVEEGDDSGDFLGFIAEQVGDCAFIIAASNGMNLDQCLAAFEHGVDSVLDEDFDVEEAIDNVNLAGIPEKE